MHVFEHALQHDADAGEDAADGVRPLPAGFVRFLDRPYTELSRFRYGFFEDPDKPGVGLHIVLDERPGGYERVWTELASDSYVAPQRWWDMGVRLFVRAGDTLYPYIEDEALMLRLRDELWRHGGFDDEQPVLLRWHAGKDGTGPFTEAISLSGLRSLLDPGVFRLLSTRFDIRVPEFHIGTRDDLIEAQQTSAVILNQLADTLDREIVAAVADRVTAAEAAWTDTDARVHETEQRLAEHRKAASQIDMLLDQHDKAWQDFVDNVLEADGSLSGRKDEARKRYQGQHEKRAAAIELYRDGLFDVNTRLEADLQGLATHRTEIEDQEGRLATLERKLPEEIAAVDRAGGELRAEIDGFSRRQVEHLRHAKNEVEALEMALGELERTKSNTATLIANAEALRAEIERAKAELERAKAQAERAKVEVERADEALRGLNETCEAARGAVDAASQSRDRERSALLQTLSALCAAVERLFSADRSAFAEEQAMPGEVGRLNELIKDVERVEQSREQLAKLVADVEKKGYSIPTLGPALPARLLEEIRERLP